LKKYGSSHVPVPDATDVNPLPLAYERGAQTEGAPAGITDVLTIGEEATVFRPVQRALRPVGWAVAHADSLEQAVAYLQSHVAAVVVIQGGVSSREWETAVSRLRGLADAPEVVVVTWDELLLRDVLRSGAFDLLRRPLNHSDLLWGVASAWHNWMTRRERRPGGGLCSDA
jgi:DNA-binding NtrC family response regulator